MNVKRLKEILKNVPEDADIVYGSKPDIPLDGCIFERSSNLFIFITSEALRDL